MSLKGKVAIVTGGSRGIGKAIAITLVKEEAKVAITYVSESSEAKAEDLQSEARKLGGEVAIIKADAGSVNAPKIIVDETLKIFNTQQIDILVNNAGVSVSQPIGKITEEIYDKTFDVNVRGVIFLVQAVVPYLPKDGSARIVNLGSISSTAGLATQTVYAGAKAAIEGITRVMAAELGASHGATVNCLNPGPIDTDMYGTVTPEYHDKIFARYPPSVANRLGTPQDIADIVLFLVQERSRWVSGDVIASHGGATFR